MGSSTICLKTFKRKSVNILVAELEYIYDNIIDNKLKDMTSTAANIKPLITDSIFFSIAASIIDLIIIGMLIIIQASLDMQPKKPVIYLKVLGL
jgi:hypothetical protein